MLESDIADWTITFVHTGMDIPIGERLRRVQDYAEGNEAFLANYADELTDLPLDHMVDRVSTISSVRTMPFWENGGYFVLRPEVFNHLPGNGDLVEDACGSLAKRQADGVSLSRLLAGGRHRQGTELAAGRLPERYPARR